MEFLLKLNILAKTQARNAPKTEIFQIILLNRVGEKLKKFVKNSIKKAITEFLDTSEAALSQKNAPKKKLANKYAIGK